jgi:hypothetical protein
VITLSAVLDDTPFSTDTVTVGTTVIFRDYHSSWVHMAQHWPFVITVVGPGTVQVADQEII